MLDVAALEFPTSAVVAGWWRQLAPWHCDSLWVGHLFWRRIETLVQIETVRKLEPFLHLILQSLTLPGAPSGREAPQTLARQLRFPEAILRQALRTLENDGLYDVAVGAITEAGRQALAQGCYRQRHWQRRTLTLLERWTDPDPSATEPIWLPIDAATATNWPAPAWDDTALRRGLNQSEDAKRRTGFPLDVVALADAAPPDIPSWQRITLVRPEKTLAVLTLGRHAAGERVLAFAARTLGPLPSTTPCLQANGSFRRLAPELMPETTDADVRSAFVAWCRQNHCPAADIPIVSWQLHGV
ncbi:MAG: hypothetical protein NZO58_09440, partial [Gemmataceae bacterium]|nr:hypothetical protein [Gemmataceae bacterium]